MIRHIALVVFLTCLSSAAGAQAPAADALPDGANYPDPPCKKPQVNMIRPATVVDNYEAVYAYNAKVKTFNKQAAAYDSCMHTYIDKANRDVKIIQDKANADLKQISERANVSMKAIQDKIQQAVTDARSVSETLDREAAKLRGK
jgi:hypothetical protein